MTINELVNNFTEHLKQYGLNGDSKQQELYKWDIISKYHDRLDAESSDFAKNISKMDFQNLWYASNQRKAMQNFAKYEPESYRYLHQFLYDESQPLQQRVMTFIDGCAKLWDEKIKDHFPNRRTSSCCDERLVSCFLAIKYPEKYTFYKNDVYKNLCDVLGANYKEPGEKLVHFYDLMNENVIPLVKSEAALCGMVEAEIAQHNYIQSLPLIAQTVIWHAMNQGMFKKKQLWLFWAGDDETLLDDMISDNYLSIYEWGEIGNLEDKKLRTQNDIRNALKEKIAEYKTKEPNHSVKMLYDMKNNMNVGDLIVCRNKNFSKIIAVGEVNGEYFYNSDHPVNNHCIEVKWNRGNWDITQLLSDSHDSARGVPRLQNITNKDWGKKMLNILEGINDMEQEEIQKSKEVAMMEQKYTKYIELLKETHNLVLTGAPGTGKTYMAQEIAKEMEAETKFVQFHPSYDYTDFVEGLRPVEKEDGQMGFERKDGVFKEFCRDAIKNLLDSEKSIESLTNELSWQEKLERFVDDAIEQGTKFKTVNGSEFVISDMKNHTIVIHNEQNEKTTQVSVNADDILELLSNNVPLNIVRDIKNYFNRKFGTQPDSYAYVITKAIRAMKQKVPVVEANKVERKSFVFIIDEINRGEASKIFGELFYAIDPGYRGKKDNMVQTQYQNLVPETDVFSKGFYVPGNVYILATMNDIDRSVESMDFAMRRRFTWKEVTPADTISMLDSLSCVTEAKATMNRLNKAISETDGLGTAYQIGPSYFLKLRENGGDFNKLWEMNIEPLLKEYLRGFRKNAEILDKFKNSYFATEDKTISESTELIDED